jgi:hypothetical protein
LDRHFLLLVALLVLAGAWFWSWRSRQNRHRHARYAHYRRRRSVLVHHERSLYELLQTLAGGDIRVLAKVRLGDMVDVEGESQSPQRQAHWRSAQRRSVDFLLCGSEDYAPLLAIQVEGKKERSRRHARGDSILEDVLSSAGIPLLVLDPADKADPAHLGMRVRAVLEPARSGLTVPGSVPGQDAEHARTEQPGFLRRLIGVLTADLQELLRRPSERWGRAC